MKMKIKSGKSGIQLEMLPSNNFKAVLIPGRLKVQTKPGN